MMPPVDPVGPTAPAVIGEERRSPAREQRGRHGRQPAALPVPPSEDEPPPVPSTPATPGRLDVVA